MFRPTLFVLLTIPLSACSTAPSVVDCPTRPPIPPSLIQPCPDLPPLTGNTMGHLAAKLVEVSGLYHSCKARHSALSDAVMEKEK